MLLFLFFRVAIFLPFFRSVFVAICQMLLHERSLLLSSLYSRSHSKRKVPNPKARRTRLFVSGLASVRLIPVNRGRRSRISFRFFSNILHLFPSRRSLYFSAAATAARSRNNESGVFEEIHSTVLHLSIRALRGSRGAQQNDLCTRAAR